MSEPIAVLVVDDEPAISAAVCANLDARGFATTVAATGEAALKAFAEGSPALAIVDLGLPDIDGSEVIRRIRESSEVPIIVLSVRDTEREKVRALDLGADDYLTKPFGVEELLARVRVALRHAWRRAAGTASVFRDGDLEVEFGLRRVCIAGSEVRLTPTEFDLLQALVTNPDRVLTDRALLRAVWGPQYGEEAHYLHVYISRLRKKIEADPGRPRYLMTEPGVGYRLQTSEASGERYGRGELDVEPVVES